MSRKRANGNEKQKAAPQIAPLMQNEAQYFQELVESSNQYSGLLKQKAQFEYIVKQLQDGRKKVQKGEITLPVNITVIPKVMSYAENDKKKVLKMFDEQIKVYQQNLNALSSQLTFAYENFTESGIRNKEYLARRFEKAKAKAIAPERTVIKDEETLFEAELKDMMKNPEKLEAFKKAKREAIKRNTKRQK